MVYAIMGTLVGPMTLASKEESLASLQFGIRVPPGGTLDNTANQRFIDQLSEYFEGNRTRFDFPLAIEGTLFQMSVWHALMRIPYGQTRSYGDIAKEIGRPKASRAVGMANHDNPIAVVIPCHRVVGQNGALTGYAGGLDLKKKLLSIEKRTLFT